MPNCFPNIPPSVSPSSRRVSVAPGDIAGNLDNTLILYKDAKVILSWNDTGLDLVNTADFSLVSLQPYRLVYRRSHSIEQSRTFTTYYYYIHTRIHPVS